MKIIKRWLALILVFVLFLSNLGGRSTKSEAAETQGNVTLSGTIYSMGYEFDRMDELSDMFTIKVTDSTGNVNTYYSDAAKYAIDLTAGETYTVNYSAYISGRMAQLKFVLKFVAEEDKELNIVIRTKNVPGLVDLNVYPCPANSVIFRNLSTPKVIDETIKFVKDKYSIKVALNMMTADM